jgi:hypothetical protein
MADEEEGEPDEVQGSERESPREGLNTYPWLATELNVWILLMLASASVVLGIFISLLQAQQKLGLEVPW